MKTRRQPKNRKGITLLETLIATVILLAAFAALGTQAAVGIQAARRVELESLSAILCQSVADELVATGQTQSTMEPQAVKGHPGWLYIADNKSPFNRSEESSDTMPILLTVSTWKKGTDTQLSKTTLTLLVRRSPFGSQTSVARGTSNRYIRIEQGSSR